VSWGDFEVVEVAPAQWKLETGIRVPVKATRAQRKTASRERAQLLLPNYADLFARVRDDGRAEASLLALWGVGRPCGLTVELCGASRRRASERTKS
jgi:hypothetical protein